MEFVVWIFEIKPLHHIRPPPLVTSIVVVVVDVVDGGFVAVLPKLYWRSKWNCDDDFLTIHAKVVNTRVLVDETIDIWQYCAVVVLVVRRWTERHLPSAQQLVVIRRYHEEVNPQKTTHGDCCRYCGFLEMAEVWFRKQFWRLT